MKRRSIKLIKEYIKLLKETEGLDSVKAISQFAHKDQKRRTGQPYFLHPQEVANLVKYYYPSNKVAYYAALLHDTMEDAIEQGNILDEEELMAFITDAIDDEETSFRVIDVVRMLTKAKGQEYAEYMSFILKDKDALIVKLADMLHNLSDNPSDRQKVKYNEALQKVSDAFSGRPGFIDQGHWDSLVSITS